MKDYILAIIFIVAALVAVDVMATVNLNAADVAAHHTENMMDWFSGTFLDWIGLGLLHLIWLSAIIGTFIKKEFYMPVGSSGWAVVIYIGGSLLSIFFIYL